jgi:hypothetical protein
MATRSAIPYQYLQTQIVAEICGNGRHEQAHHARRTYRSKSPSGSPIAGSRRCGDSRGSTASYCGNSAPLLYYSSSRTLSTSSITVHKPNRIKTLTQFPMKRRTP